jgi:addiction module HigA family antidote
MALMHNPPHPGKVLREYLGEIEVSDAAVRLGVSRTTLSRVLNGRAGISADKSLRLSDALGTHTAFWSGMQMECDLRQARRKPGPKISPFRQAA